MTYGGARGYSERALEMREALYPKDSYPQGHPDLAGSLNNLGSLLEAQGDYGEARGYLERALAMREPFTPRTPIPRAIPTWPKACTTWAVCSRPRATTRARALPLASPGDVPGPLPQGQLPAGTPRLAASLNNLGRLL